MNSKVVDSDLLLPSMDASTDCVKSGPPVGRPAVYLPELLRFIQLTESSEKSPSSPTLLDGDRVGEGLRTESERV